MNRNELYYRHIMGAVGAAMLFFVLFINVFGVLIELLDFILAMLCESFVLHETVYQLFYACGYMLCFMMPVLIMKKLILHKQRPYYSMQAPLKVTPWIFLMIPALVTVSFSASYLNSYFVELLPFPTSMPILETDLTQYAPYQIVLQFIVICIVPGFCEEFLFRGAILTNCLPFGRSNAILISAFLFAVMHQNPLQFFYTFVAGILLGLIYERTGSIWNTTILHILNNFISLTESILITKYPSWFESSVAVALFETGLFTVGTACAIILIFKFFSKKRTFENGVFGASDHDVNVVPAYGISKSRMVTLFLTPTMVIFLVLSLLSMLLIFLMMAVSGYVLA